MQLLGSKHKKITSFTIICKHFFIKQFCIAVISYALSVFNKKSFRFLRSYLVAGILEKSNPIVTDSFKIVFVSKNPLNTVLETILEAFLVLQYGCLVCSGFQ